MIAGNKIIVLDVFHFRFVIPFSDFAGNDHTIADIRISSGFVNEQAVPQPCSILDKIFRSEIAGYNSCGAHHLSRIG